MLELDLTKCTRRPNPCAIEDNFLLRSSLDISEKVKKKLNVKALYVHFDNAYIITMQANISCKPHYVDFSSTLSESGSVNM